MTQAVPAPEETPEVEMRLCQSNVNCLPESALRKDRAYMRMPQELWGMVVRYLPSLTGRYAATKFGFKLEENYQRHSGIWYEIWEDNKWTSCATNMGLVPFLVGSSLHGLADNPKQPALLALMTGDKTGQIRLHRKQLLSSLRPHHLNERNEVVFHDSRIILNVSDALYNTHHTVLSPETLFTDYDGSLRSASLYWQDEECKLRTIGPEDIVGIGGPAVGLHDVSLICGITLTHPREMGLVDRRQYRFQHPNCPSISPLLPIVYNSDGCWILGWELVDNPQS